MDWLGKDMWVVYIIDFGVVISRKYIVDWNCYESQVQFEEIWYLETRLNIMKNH